VEHEVHDVRGEAKEGKNWIVKSPLVGIEIQGSSREIRADVISNF
jgi:hypothetical protein